MLMSTKGWKQRERERGRALPPLEREQNILFPVTLSHHCNCSLFRPPPLFFTHLKSLFFSSVVFFFFFFFSSVSCVVHVHAQRSVDQRVERIGVRGRIKRGFGRSRGTATTAHHRKTPSGYKEDKKSECAIKKEEESNCFKRGRAV